jgi:hypothetical protein
MFSFELLPLLRVSGFFCCMAGLACNTGLKTHGPPPLRSVIYLNRSWTNNEENPTYVSLVSVLYEDIWGFTHCLGEPVGITFNQDIALAFWIKKVSKKESVLMVIAVLKPENNEVIFQIRLDEPSPDRPAIDFVVSRSDLSLYKLDQRVPIVDERRPGSVRSKYIRGGGTKEGRDVDLDTKDTESNEKSGRLRVNNFPHDSVRCASHEQISCSEA